MDARFAPINAYAPSESVYQASRTSAPVAGLGAAAVAAGLLSSFLFMNVVIERKGAPKPLVVELLKMPLEQPAPEAQRKEPHNAVAKPQIVAPPPQVALPATPSPIAVSPETPPPAPVAQPGPAAAAAPPSVGAAEPSDLTGNLLSAHPPSYPVESRRLREQGTVVLAVQVSTEGTVDELSVAKSSGYVRLDRAALHAVRRWRWSPFRHHGTSVMVRGQVTIPFVLTT